MRIAMIANTRYESDARVRRAALAALVRRTRTIHVDFFAVSGGRLPGARRQMSSSCACAVSA